MFQSIFHAIADGTRNLTTELRSEGATNGIATERQGKIGLLMPPDTQIDDAMQTELWEKKLAFVNEKSGVHRVCFHGVDNLVEGHDNGFEIGLEEFKGEICGGF